MFYVRQCKCADSRRAGKHTMISKEFIRNSETQSSWITISRTRTKITLMFTSCFNFLEQLPLSCANLYGKCISGVFSTTAVIESGKKSEWKAEEQREQTDAIKRSQQVSVTKTFSFVVKYVVLISD